MLRGGSSDCTCAACCMCCVSQWTAEDRRAKEESERRQKAQAEAKAKEKRLQKEEAARQRKEEARRQEEEARLQAVHTGPVIVEGQKAGEPGAKCMGVFELMEPPLLMNGRAVYQKAGGSMYFYFGSDTKWHISAERAMRAGKAKGGYMCSAAAQPNALTPEQVKGSWTVLSSGASGCGRRTCMCGR